MYLVETPQERGKRIFDSRSVAERKSYGERLKTARWSRPVLIKKIKLLIAVLRSQFFPLSSVLSLSFSCLLVL